MTNKELQEHLKQYPDDAIFIADQLDKHTFFNTWDFKYDKESNTIYIIH